MLAGDSFRGYLITGFLLVAGKELLLLPIVSRLQTEDDVQVLAWLDLGLTVLGTVLFIVGW